MVSRSPWTLRHAHTHARAWRYCPRQKARHCVSAWRGGWWRGVCVAAGCTSNDRWQSADFLKTNKHWDPTKSTRTQASQSTRGRAHAHLCVVALLGGCCGWLSRDSGGRRESELPPTFVSVRSVVTDLSTCVAYVSAHLKHTCVKSYHNGTFL